MLAAVAILATILGSSTKLKSMELDVEASGLLTQKLSELEVKTYEFFTYKDAWTKKVWKEKQGETSLLVKDLVFHAPDAARMREELLANMESVATLFGRLSSVVPDDGDQSDSGKIRLNEQISGVLLLYLQTDVELARNFAKKQIKAMAEEREIADNIVIAIGVLSMIIIGIVSFFTLFSIVRSMTTLQEEVASFGKGQWSSRVDESSRDEVGSLAKTFNVMASEIESNLENLNDSYKEVIEYRDNLEATVEERTKHLQAEIKDRLHAEKSLSEKENQLQEILDNSPYGVSIVTCDTKERVYINNRFVDLFGGKSKDDEAMFNLIDSYLSEEDMHEIWSEFERDGQISGREQLRKRVDGSVWWSLVYWMPFKFQNKDVILSWIYDVTEVKATQEQLLQTEKMASLGGLVAGVAHEINTPLGIGVTATSYFQTKIADLREKFEGKKLKQSSLGDFLDVADESIAIIEGNLARAAELVRSFKKVSVDQSSEQQRPVNIREYFDDVVLSLRPQLKQTKIDIKLGCDKNLQIVTNPGALSQTLVILIMNSLTHGFLPQEEGIIAIDVLRTSDRVNIRYRDSGKGIPEENVSRIFDPFFTTNRAEGGSGLGLNIAYNQIKSVLDGQLTYCDAPGGGAEFNISFPLAQTEALRASG